jgi:peptidoglycan hydrolase-like protein with peptidoglycan-binding domain
MKNLPYILLGVGTVGIGAVLLLRKKPAVLVSPATAKLPPSTAAKVQSTIASANNPAFLNQLASGLARLGATDHANDALQKSADITGVPQSVPGVVAIPSDLAGIVSNVVSSLPKPSHATIRQGSSGNDVQLWQSVIGVAIDGKFGPKTAAATKSWQAQHGLTADGIVGPQTWGASGV